MKSEDEPEDAPQPFAKLGMQVVTAALKSSDPLRYLREVTQNFPM